MQSIKAPDREPAKFPSVFLAGGITGCPDWQSGVTNALAGLPITVFNPRRDMFPDDPAAEEEQIRWEFERLRSATLVAFWFPKETLNPITLFEFGADMERTKPFIVGVDPEYARISDLEIQMKLRRPDVSMIRSLGELTDAIKAFFKAA